LLLKILNDLVTEPVVTKTVSYFSVSEESERRASPELIKPSFLQEALKITADKKQIQKM
jgi:hypothetical protein